MNTGRRTLDEALNAMRPPGRPSLSTSGSSPVIRVRVPRGMHNAIERIIRETGVDRASWLRQALREAALRDLTPLVEPGWKAEPDAPRRTAEPDAT